VSRDETIASLKARVAGWQRREAPVWPAAGLGPDADGLACGDLVCGALHEFLPASPADFAATAGFVLAAAARVLRRRDGHVLWAVPGRRGGRGGRLCPLGLAGFGIDPARVLHVEAPRPRDLLWSLEEALACGALAAVVGVLPEGDRAYDFTASRRLSMRAAQSGATALLVGDGGSLDMATAALSRWSVAAAASPPAHYTGQAVPGLGPPRWHARLLKSRKGAPGELWNLEWSHETLSFRLAAPLGDRPPLRHAGGAAPGQWTAA
jgi:protein ImuA